MPTKSPEGKIRISQKRARLQSISGHFSALYAPLWSQKCHKGARRALKNHEKSSFFHFFSIFRHFLTRIRPETGPKSLRSWDFWGNPGFPGISCQILGFPGNPGISWEIRSGSGFGLYHGISVGSFLCAVLVIGLHHETADSFQMSRMWELSCDYRT